MLGRRGRRLALASLFAVLLAASGVAETGEAPVPARWFELLGALDGSETARARFLALYAEDALHIQGPAGPDQRGAATFRGREKVGLLVDRLLGEWRDHQVRPEVATAAETSATLWPEAQGPWGRPLVAAQFTHAGTRREDGARWLVPGAVFFRVRDGELVRVRVYLGRGEAAEVEIQR